MVMLLCIIIPSPCVRRRRVFTFCASASAHAVCAARASLGDRTMLQIIPRISRVILHFKQADGATRDDGVLVRRAVRRWPTATLSPDA